MRRGGHLLSGLLVFLLLPSLVGPLQAQHCAPIQESYLSEIALQQSGGMISLRGSYFLNGGAGQDAFQVYVIAYLERDAARVPTPDSPDLIDESVALVLHTQVIERNAKGVFPLEMWISADDLAQKMIKFGRLSGRDRQVDGDRAVYRDQVRLAVFIPWLDDAKYSVLPGLPDDRHCCNYAGDRALLFQTLPYRLRMQAVLSPDGSVAPGRLGIEIKGERSVSPVKPSAIDQLKRETPVCRLVIENPEGFLVEIERVGEGQVRLGDAKRFEFELQADRYVVHAGGLDYPAPLMPRVRYSTFMLIRLGPAPVAVPGFVFIPGGPTLIGDVLGVGAPRERPARVLQIDAFFVATTETTTAQYVEFLNARKICDEDWIDLDGPKCPIRRTEEGLFETDAPDLPVVTVSYSGATEYCAWLSQKTGVAHRLPTEHEWERVARGPSSSTYSYGDVYEPGAANQESGRLMEVRSFGLTGWGVYDLTGNAFEWTSSDYDEGLKVLRGGSYVLDGPFLRNSFRMWYRPLVQADDIGFRVVREVEK